MNEKVKIDDWYFYCYTETDKKSGKFYARWMDMLDRDAGESTGLFSSEKDALNAAKNGAMYMCGFKYKQEKDPEMQKIIDLIHGKTEE